MLLNLRTMNPVKEFYDDLAEMSGVTKIRNFLLVTFSSEYLPQIGFYDRAVLYR